MGTLVTMVLGSVLKNVIASKITGNPLTPAEDVAEPHTKGLIASQTAWGSTMALIMFLVQGGWPDSSTAWGVIASAVVVWGITLYGRIKADKAIG